MATSNLNPTEALREEILADARRESDEIVRRARQEAAGLLARAATEAEQLRQQHLAAARAEAERRKESVLATVPVEAGRLRSARVEALLQSLFDEVRRRLLARDGFDSREMVIALAVEALRQMAGDQFVVTLASEERLGTADGLAGEITRRVGRSPLNLRIAESSAFTGAGPIIRDAAELQTWDNRLASRLERLWPEFRRQLAAQTSLVRTTEPTGGAK